MDIEEDIIVREMDEEDAEKLDRLLEKPAGIQSIYKSYLEETTSGKCEYMVIYYGGDMAGYAKIDWKSSYEDFEELGIAEVREMQILEAFRGKGFAGHLLDAVEEKVRHKSDYCGMGVGLAEPYEPAQRLLAERGYEPDGKGVFYLDPDMVQDELEVDDYQALMLIKKLN